MRMSHVEIEVKYHSGRETRNLTEHCVFAELWVPQYEIGGQNMLGN